MYPIRSLVLIAIDVTVIWALTVHGRDITMEVLTSTGRLEAIGGV